VIEGDGPMKERVSLPFAVLLIGLVIFLTSILSVQAEVETHCGECFTCSSCCESLEYVSGTCSESCEEGEIEETSCNKFCYSCSLKCCCVPPECYDNEDCDDDLFCNGPETCEDGKCMPGTPIDCSEYNLPEIGTCDNDPDNCQFTWDFALPFTSECDEENDECTTGEYTFTHTCADDDLEDTVPFGGCGAECDENEDCACPTDECSDHSLIDYPDYGLCREDCTCDVGEECEEPCEPTIINCSEQDTETGYCKCDCPPYTTNGEDTVDCYDGIDNDCDGLTDSEDSDCIPTTTTTTTIRRRGGGGRVIYITTTTTTTSTTTTTTKPAEKAGMDILTLLIPSDVIAGESFEVGIEVKNIGGEEGTDDITIALPEGWVADKWGDKVTLKPNEMTIVSFTITPSEDSGEIAAGSSIDFEVSGMIIPRVRQKPMPITGFLLAALASLWYWILIPIVLVALILFFEWRKPSRKKPYEYKHKSKKK